MFELVVVLFAVCLGRAYGNSPQSILLEPCANAPTSVWTLAALLAAVICDFGQKLAPHHAEELGGVLGFV